MPSTPLALPATSAEHRIAALPCGDRMKKALGLVADGMPYRDAAKEVGYRDPLRGLPLGETRWPARRSQRAARGDIQAHRVALERRSRAQAHRDPEAIPTRDLAIIGGIAADKAAKYESWGKPQTPNGSAPLLDLLAKIHADNRGIRLEVTYKSLLANTQDSTLAEYLEHAQMGGQFAIVGRASLPERPLGLTRSGLTLVGAVAGVLVGVTLVVAPGISRARRT